MRWKRSYTRTTKMALSVDIQSLSNRSRANKAVLDSRRLIGWRVPATYALCLSPGSVGRCAWYGLLRYTFPGV